MTPYDFFQEKILPWFKGDYQEFSSKTVDGYFLYIAIWDKEPRQAMITTNALALLQRIFDRHSESTGNKEAGLLSSQVSRWYVNGFTSAYNYYRRYDLDHPFKHTDFAQWSVKLNSSDDLERGEWNLDMFRRYTINLGRREGTLFYVAEKESCNGQMVMGHKDQPKDKANKLSPIVPETEDDYHFPDGLLEELYKRFNGELFKDLVSPDEFKSIITRKSHTSHLAACSQKKMLMYKILHDLSLLLPEDIRTTWLEDIAKECGYKVENINKKYKGSDSVTEAYHKKMEQIDHIFSKYSRT